MTSECGARMPASQSCSSSTTSDFDDLLNALDEDNEQLYAEIKAEFLTSPFCEADKVLNDPKQRLNPILFRTMMDRMGFVTNSQSDREKKIKIFENLVETYQLSAEVRNYGLSLLENYQDTVHDRYMVLARLRGVVVQNMNENSKNIPGYMAEDLKDKLADQGIFTEDQAGGPECPFISKDAFMKALRGRDAILKTPNKARLTKPDLITIVDYSIPSNRRRMFVVDLKSKKVLHNTWTAHGGGVDRAQEKGVDGLGSSPQMSNAAGTVLSSEGFHIGIQAAAGGTYGPNLITDGIDLNNTKIKSRGVVLHGFRTPYHEYLAGMWEYKNDKRVIPARDIVPNLMKFDFKNASEDEIDTVVAEIRSTIIPYPYIDATNGCLGVPEANVRQLDRKSRDKSQLELLREDLPGSLMFNYSGPEMKSKYF